MRPSAYRHLECRVVTYLFAEAFGKASSALPVASALRTKKAVSLFGAKEHRCFAPYGSKAPVRRAHRAFGPVLIAPKAFGFWC